MEREQGAAPPTDGGEPEFDFSETYHRVKDAPCRVERIRLEGLERTKRSVVVPALLRLVQREGTLDEIKEAALEAWDELRDLDIFEAVDVVLDQGSKVLHRCCLWSCLLPCAHPVDARGSPKSGRRKGVLWARAGAWPIGAQRLPAAAARLRVRRSWFLDQQSQQDVIIVARFQERGMVRLHAGTYVQGTEGAPLADAQQQRSRPVAVAGGGCRRRQQRQLCLRGACRGAVAPDACSTGVGQPLRCPCPRRPRHQCRPLTAHPTHPPLPAGSVETSLNLTNPLGHAEQISLGAEYGTQSTNVYTLSATKPVRLPAWATAAGGGAGGSSGVAINGRQAGVPAVADLRLHQLFHDYGRWSSYSELLRGGVATLTRWAGADRRGWRGSRVPVGAWQLGGRLARGLAGVQEPALSAAAAEKHCGAGRQLMPAPRSPPAALLLARHSGDGRRALSYELAWRRLSDPGRAASRAVLSQVRGRLAGCRCRCPAALLPCCCSCRRWPRKMPGAAAGGQP